MSEIGVEDVILTEVDKFEKIEKMEDDIKELKKQFNLLNIATVKTYDFSNKIPIAGMIDAITAKNRVKQTDRPKFFDLEEEEHSEFAKNRMRQHNNAIANNNRNYEDVKNGIKNRFANLFGRDRRGKSKTKMSSKNKSNGGTKRNGNKKSGRTSRKH
jgi:hypothetical protein